MNDPAMAPVLSTVRPTGPPPASVSALYVTQWASLVRTAAMLLGGVAAGEDAVQEAFVRLSLRHPSGWDHEWQLAYLRRTVINLSHSVLRRRRVAARHLPPPGRDVASAADHAIVAFERGQVAAALGRLPNRQRETVVLRYYADLTLAEIAAAMGVSVGTAKSNLSKGTAALSLLLEDLR